MAPDTRDVEARILILRGGSIGDFILTLPAFAALRRQWPNAHIELIGYPHIAQLALAGGLAQVVTSLEKASIARLFALNAVIDEKQAEYLKSFHFVLSYLFDPDNTVKRHMLEAGVRQVLYGSPRVLAGHAIDTLMKPLEELAIYSDGVEFSQLTLTAEHRGKGVARAREFGGKIMAIHPGSGSPKKNWPLERFVALAGKLRAECRVTPVFTLGEADRDISRALKAEHSDIAVFPTGSLVLLAEFLSACAGYVGNDSGITHLAAALGIPVVALFGPSDPAMWAPRGPNTKVIASGGGQLDAITVEQVMDGMRLET